MHGLIRPMFRPSILIWLESRLITASPSLKLARRCDRRADASFVVTGGMRPPVSVAGIPRRSRRWSFRGGRAPTTLSRRRATVQGATRKQSALLADEADPGHFDDRLWPRRRRLAVHERPCGHERQRQGVRAA